LPPRAPRTQRYLDKIYRINRIFNHEKHEAHEGGFGGSSTLWEKFSVLLLEIHFCANPEESFRVYYRLPPKVAKPQLYCEIAKRKLLIYIAAQEISE
jgi:hypothetical protein